VKLRRIGWVVITAAISSMLFSVMGIGFLDTLSFFDQWGWFAAWVARFGVLGFGLWLLQQADG
jgi:hypothetical protein